MIIYGSKGTVLAGESVKCNCPNCEAQNSIQMYIAQRYAHVYWIPLFPTKKSAISECNNCKQVLDQKDFPHSFDRAHDTLKSNTKAPWWTYIGVILIGVLIVVGVITSQQNDKENAEFILEPKPGDVYEVKLRSNEYTLYKVDRVEGNIVYLFENQYSVDKSSGFRKLKKKPYYEDSSPVLKSDLKNMLDSGEIMDVDRD